MTRRSAFPSVVLASLLGLAALGCDEAHVEFCPDCADTDADRYVPGADAFAIFTNNAAGTRYLGGCTTFELQKRVGRFFESRGREIVCVFEGFVVAVEPGETLEETFRVPLETGEWRLSYTVGAGCSEGQPLSEHDCRRIVDVASEPFSVERELCAADTPECRFVPAAPNYLCDDGVTVGGPSGDCTRDPVTGTCGYEIVDCPLP